MVSCEWVRQIVNRLSINRAPHPIPSLNEPRNAFANFQVLTYFRFMVLNACEKNDRRLPMNRNIGRASRLSPSAEPTERSGSHGRRELGRRDARPTLATTRFRAHGAKLPGGLSLAL